MLFCASIATEQDVQSTMIQQVYAYVSANLENNPLPVLYDANNGSQVSGGGSPAVGAMFAPLAMNLSKIDISTSGLGRGSSKVSAGTIAGAVVGGVAFLALLGGLGFFFRRRLDRKATGRYNQDYQDPDRIQPVRVKPISFPSDSTLEPLTATVHPDMHDLRAMPFAMPLATTNASQSDLPAARSPTSNLSQSRSGGTSSAYRGPMAVRNLADDDLERSDAAYTAIQAASQGGSSSSRARSVSDPKAAMQQEALRSEVDDLRRQIEQMKEERTALGEAPPSYEEELLFANAVAKQNYS